ncbi:MAG: methyltransferase domain-containing protein [Chlamydiota bacterium]
MNRQEQVSAYWGRQDATLRSMFLNPNAQYLENHEKPEIISYFPNLKGKKILELAAGIGRFTRYFATTCDSVTAVDITAQFIEKNRQDHADCKNATFICSDAMNLEFPDNSYDFIFFNWLFLYLDDSEVELLMDRIHAWLKPNGELFFRETCKLIRSTSMFPGYFANYRTLSYYDSLVKKRFHLLKEGHIKTYVDCFGDPLQGFWHCQKT